MQLSALERGFALRARLLVPIMDYMSTVKLLDLPVENFEALQAMPELELNRLRVLLPYLRASIRLALHNGAGMTPPKVCLLQAVASGWCHKVLRPKGVLLTTSEAVILCRELGATQHSAERQARELKRDTAIVMIDTNLDGRTRYLCPTISTVTKMLEGCIYFNVVRMLESEEVGGPEYFKLLDKPKVKNVAARTMLERCREAYDSVYAEVAPEERVILGAGPQPPVVDM